MYCHIGQCTGVCCGKITKEEYLQVIRDVMAFLEGRRDELVVRLLAQMEEAAERLEFERAAKIRDQVQSIQTLTARQKVVSTALEDQDVVALATDDVNTISEMFFVRGGKLPGLYGGRGHSGGVQPAGDDGFSMRLMWREAGQGEVYAYLPHGATRHGRSLLRGRWQFVPGRWHQVTQQIALNTPGRANGRLRMWLDGSLVGSVDDLHFRDSPQLHIDGVFVDVFFGGNDDSWAPQADSHVDLADFALADAAPGL